MTQQPNELVALEWLIAPLNEQIDALYARQDNDADEALSYVGSQYKDITNVLTMANLPEFYRLAKLIAEMANHVSQTPTEDSSLFLPVVLHASKLLQHELNYYAKSSFVRKHLLELRIHYLLMILTELGVETEQQNVWQATLGNRFSEQISFEPMRQESISLERQQEIEHSWYTLGEKLAQSTQDKVLFLGNLYASAFSMAGAMTDDVLKKLWATVVAWIDSLILNEELHADDVYLLNKLNRAFGLKQDMSIADMLWLENVLVDIYISLMHLPMVGRNARDILDKIDNSIKTEKTFFPYVMLTLTQVIKSLDDDRIAFDVLGLLKDRLYSRGWSFYAKNIEDIIDYAENANSSQDSFIAIKAQIKNRLQDLYDTIKKTHEAVEAKTDSTQYDGGALSGVYIAIEEIKNSFTEYLGSKDITDLPDVDGLDQLTHHFVEMGMDEVVAVSQKLTELFTTLYQKAPSRISWQMAHDIADGLSLFEMFLDNLVRQIFDKALLTKANESISATLATINALDDKHDNVVELVDIYAKLLKAHENTILYDDNGVVEPAVGEVVHSYRFDEDEMDLEDVEDVIIEAETAYTPNPRPIVMPEPVLKPASQVLTQDETVSKEIFLTDMLSLPSISLSDGANNDNDLHATAVQALNLTGERSQAEFVADIAPVAKSDVYQIAKDSLKADDFSMDKEFRDIFVEEADEVIDELHVHLTHWQKDINDLSVLKEIRRNFHTLKGSGRMVGANEVGETAWAIENMLNRVLDHTIRVNADVVSVVEETADVMPMMVQDFATGQPPSIDNALIVLQTHNILKGRPLKFGMPSAQPKAEMPSLAEPQPVVNDVAENAGETAQAQETLAQIPEVATEPTVSAVEIAPIAQADLVEKVADEPVPSPANPTDNVVELPTVLHPFLEAASLPLVSIYGDGEVDADIKEIFIEEAREVLDDIVPTFKTWRADRQNKELLIEVRRGFHTLKGSGRMVGAMELGELAWSLENMLNRVLDETVAMNEGMCTLVSEVLGEFGGLVKLFEDNATQYPDQVILWTAVAHAYSKGHGDEFDYRTFSHNPAYHEADWNASKAPPKPVITPTGDHASTHALASIQEAGERMSNATVVKPATEEEQMLCDIFVEECQELLVQVKDFLAVNKDKASVPVNDEVVRVFHTLRGASGLPSLSDVGEVGAMIERVLQNLQHHDEPMNPTHLDALENAVGLIEECLSSYKTATKNEGELCSACQEFIKDKQSLETLLPTLDKTPSVSELIEGVDSLLDGEVELPTIAAQDKNAIMAYAKVQLGQIDVLTDRTPDRPKFQRLLAILRQAYLLMSDYPQCTYDKDFMALLMTGHGELTGLFDSLAGSMSLHLDDVALAKLSDGVVRHTVDFHRQKHLQDGNNAVVAVFNKPLNDELHLEAVKTDDELLQIFLDEVLELDEQISTALKAWYEDRSPTQLQALQRYLHTIKGGARLAGIKSINELTLEAETVFKKLSSGQLTLSQGWFNIIGQLYDVLSLQFGMIQKAKQSFFADRTIAELRGHLANGVVADDASVYVPTIDFDDDEELFDETEVKSDEPSAFDEAMTFSQLIDESWQGNVPDKDILDVFLEEAKDLAESSSEDFAAFRLNTGDVETLHALQRKLHTIKGGARMVSANGMADLAHEMETIYEDLGNRRRPATKMVTQLLFACHDWITGAVALLEEQYNPPRPTPLIDALKQFTQNPDSLQTVPQVSLEQDTLMVAHYKARADEVSGVRNISKMPPIKGVFGEETEFTGNNEMIRISAPLMEQMINLSGEAAINRARIDMNMVSLTSSIEEMGATAQRLSDQLRRMDLELEEQILAQLDTDELDAGFDPLEMDQYSSLNQLSKSLSESASDLLDIKATLLEKTRDSENLLLQLSRTQAQLQDSLMSSRMVPFSRLTPRLQRIVRQTAGELGKTVELMVINADDEMDRNILDHITSPLEHMLRNAIDHGIEFPDYRSEIGKMATGHIVLEVRREGDEIVIILSDDGAGINVDAVRKKAISQGLIHENEQLSDNDIMQYIFNSGLSTTNKITQISGRGVGMDVVRTEIRQLGGSVSVESERGKGSRFTIRVPLTVAMADTLVVRVADRHYAVPLIQIDRVVQVDTDKLQAFYQSTQTMFEIEGEQYRLRYLDEILSHNEFTKEATEASLPVIIIKNRVGQLLALQVDEIVGSRTEVVVKPLGRQLSHLSGISAATIMGDGSVMLILDLLALMRTTQARTKPKTAKPKTTQRDLIMVVDDSVTVRKVTSRLLERHGFDVLVAKDGVDAVEKLQDTIPSLMLLDIEMPRMDGFEVATQVRNSPRLQGLPIIMITSRTGEKHRERALDIGVNDYMGKPYQEADLLTRIQTILDKE